MSDESKTPLTEYDHKALFEWSPSIDEKVCELERQLAETRRDSERLEWLEKNRLLVILQQFSPLFRIIGRATLRQAIDNAMKGQDDEANTGRNLEAERTER